MSEYAPTTGEVRRRYAYARSGKPGHKNQGAVAEFDRWLAQYTAVKRAEWEAELGWEYGIGAEYEDNPRRVWRDDEYDITTELLEALDDLDDAKSGGTFSNAIVIRRRPRDAWHRLPDPVRDSDTNESEGRAVAEYEARISIYRNGRRIEVSDAHGSSPTEALYFAHNDLELKMQGYELARPREFNESEGKA